MKRIYSIVCISILIIGCQPPPDNSANEAFEKNSETARAYLEGFQNESVDYSNFAADFVMNGTGYGGPDSVTLEQKIEANKDLWASFDFELNPKPLVFLPGVNADTKMADGSVRYYGTWTVTLPATDSTEAKSAKVKAYESFDFNENGEIIYQQFFADTSGLMADLMKVEE